LGGFKRHLVVGLLLAQQHEGCSGGEQCDEHENDDSFLFHIAMVIYMLECGVVSLG